MLIECNTVYNMDCLEGMKHIPDKSIDMILCDLPYGVTACSWDYIIPIDPLWEQYKRIIKDYAIIALTSTQPFTTDLINGNRGWFKYCWIWDKGKSGFPLHAKNMPLRRHEDICIFSNGVMNHKTLTAKRMFYNPQGLIKIKPKTKKRNIFGDSGFPERPSLKGSHTSTMGNYPDSIIKIAAVSNAVHPTQKPIELFEYLIKTYTTEGDIVLDNCMGSFTTAIAAENTKRKWIGFEKDKDYCELGSKRIRENRMRLDILNRAYQKAKECHAKKLKSA